MVWLLISGSFYLVSCYLGARGGGRPGLPFILVAALAFRLTAWPLYPALSDDVFRYRWEGQLQNTGGNPYHARPNDVAWAHLRDQAFPLVPGRDFKAVYGPLAELAQAATFRAVDAFTRDPFVQAFWFKLPAALFDLGAIAMLALWLRALGLPRERLVIYAWSPLAIFEFWATGHNDAMLVFFLTAALIAAARDRWWWSYAALTLAAAVKIWPLALFPLFVRSRGRWRELAGVPPLAAVLLLPTGARDGPVCGKTSGSSSGFWAAGETTTACSACCSGRGGVLPHSFTPPVRAGITKRSAKAIGCEPIPKSSCWWRRTPSTRRTTAWP